MSFTQFVKPYPDGYEDFESGGTPVTAAILNTNYDGFLLALNTWALQAETDIGSKADTNDVGNAFATVNGRIDSLEGTVSTKSTVTIRDLLSSGTKIGTIAINGSDYDLYAPSGGGGGSSVTWNQIVSTGTKIAEIEIDGVSTDVYAPSGSGTGGHTIINENGTSMTARSGLQFVGGVNVADDGTNDKTIVDLASAGGIDGVFVDIENVIQQSTSYSGSMTYTATQDCAVLIGWANKANDSVYVKIDGVNAISRYAGGITAGEDFLYLKKGQVLTVTNGYTDAATIYIVYGIQTGTTHSKFQPVIYSLEEREIGVWTDGKPLYEKTYELSASFVINAHTWGTTSIDVSFVDKFIGEADIVTSGGQGYVCFTDVNNNNNLQLYNPRYDAGIGVKFITVRYTKTTDVAGSGTWTPQGVPTHHYSTDEHIIGTWIDGSTLYEKTIDFGTLPNASIKSVNTNVSNIGLVTKVNGFAYSSGATINIPYIEASNTSSKQTIDIWHNKSTNKVDINTNFDASGFYGYVVIQYTKLS